MFLFRDALAQAGQGEELLLAHKRVKSCWEAWEIDEARFSLRVSKRAALEVIANTQLVVYVSRAAALADLGANYPGNRLLLDLAREEQAEVRRAAEAVLSGEASRVEQLAAAAEAAGDPRAATIRQLRFLAG